MCLHQCGVLACDVALLAVFIYSMPGYSCSIRERMLYSSCKSSVIEVIENQCQLNITKKVGTNLTRAAHGDHRKSVPAQHY